MHGYEENQDLLNEISVQVISLNLLINMDERISCQIINRSSGEDAVVHFGQ